MLDCYICSGIGTSAKTQGSNMLSFILSTSKPLSVTFCVFYSSQAAKSSKCSFRRLKTWPLAKVKAPVLQTTVQTQYRLFSLHLYKIIIQIPYFRFRPSTIIIERLRKFQSQGSEGLRKLQIRRKFSFSVRESLAQCNHNIWGAGEKEKSLCIT